jgi:hypothetical protein
MAASFTIAARNNGFSKADTRASTLASVAAYRLAMAEFAQMPTMDIWYAHLTDDDVMAAVRGAVVKIKKGGEEGEVQAGGQGGPEGAEDRGEDAGEGVYP